MSFGQSLNITQGLATVCIGQDPVTLSDITIAEQGGGAKEYIGTPGVDATETLILTIPNGHKFVNGSEGVTFNAGRDIQSATIIGADKSNITIEITYFNATGGATNDQLVITGIQVADDGGGPATVNITRLGGSINITGLPDNTIVGTVTLHPRLTVDAGANTNLCMGSTLVLGGSPTASGTPAYTYSWSPATNLDDATIANPTFTPPSAGSYFYTLTVTDGSPCTVIDAVTITVADGLPPVVTIVPSSNPVCAGDNVVLTGSTVTNAGGIWSTDGDGGFSPNNTTVAATYVPGAGDIALGSVNLTLTSNASGCSVDTKSELITITPTPTSVAGPDASICYSVGGSYTLPAGNASS
ncbi:MAG: hypothetical protein OEY51_12225, partial [Cyclobacteriaceae bacterium]|nr:hypothetical protein [Cyclobacteriaceae bacterium]